MTPDGRTHEVRDLFGRGSAELFRCYVCDNCKRLSVAHIYADPQHYVRIDLDDWFEGVGDHGWVPRTGVGKKYPDVPDQLAAAASEAHECLSIGAARGAVAIARAVVEATAKHSGILTGSLEQKIDALAERGLIRGHIREVAHEVRLDGNEVAHGDLVATPISIEEARDVVDLLDEILHDAYQSKAIAERVRANRTSRQAPPPS